MKRAEEMELIEETEIGDTEDGGARITCVLSKDLVHTILTMWMSDAIESETKKVLEKNNGRYEPIKTETPTVAGKDGGVPNSAYESEEKIISQVEDLLAGPWVGYWRSNGWKGFPGAPNPSDQR